MKVFPLNHVLVTVERVGGRPERGAGWPGCRDSRSSREAARSLLPAEAVLSGGGAQHRSPRRRSLAGAQVTIQLMYEIS